MLKEIIKLHRKAASKEGLKTYSCSYLANFSDHFLLPGSWHHPRGGEDEPCPLVPTLQPHPENLRRPAPRRPQRLRGRRPQPHRRPQQRGKGHAKGDLGRPQGQRRRKELQLSQSLEKQSYSRP